MMMEVIFQRTSDYSRGVFSFKGCGCRAHRVFGGRDLAKTIARYLHQRLGRGYGILTQKL